MCISSARTALLAAALTSIALAVSLACAACEPPGPDHTAEKIQCLRACAAQKDTCIINAKIAAHIQQCDGQNQACVETCPL